MKCNPAMFIITLNTQVQFGVREGRQTRSPRDSIWFGYPKDLGVWGKKKGEESGEREIISNLNLQICPSKWYFSGSFHQLIATSSSCWYLHYPVRITPSSSRFLSGVRNKGRKTKYELILQTEEKKKIKIFP